MSLLIKVLALLTGGVGSSHVQKAIALRVKFVATDASVAVNVVEV